jgi:beta-lactamase superfamily II metal-dependent hydrolase
MYEIDFMAVGKGQDSGDAIAMRFARPDRGGYAHVIIDAGFEDDGKALVRHVQRYYDTDSIDLAILTHPDGDHIGGMGVVVRELRVGTLCLHKLRERGGAGLRAAGAVDELVGVAAKCGTRVHEPFAGHTALGGALTFLGPDAGYYAQMVAEQQRQEGKAAKRASMLLEAARSLEDRLLGWLPGEVPFDDGEGTSPRNNTSLVTLLEVDGERMLFTGDVGVPALDRAWNWLEARGLDTYPPDFVQVPHHGSRRNASSALLDRLLGPIRGKGAGEAIVSVGDRAPKHPSGRVVNAYRRRGFPVCATAARTICQRSADAPQRVGWLPVEPLGPMDESDDD